MFSHEILFPYNTETFSKSYDEAFLTFFFDAGMMLLAHERMRNSIARFCEQHSQKYGKEIFNSVRY